MYFGKELITISCLNAHFQQAPFKYKNRRPAITAGRLKLRLIIHALFRLLIARIFNSSLRGTCSTDSERNHGELTLF